MLGVKLTAKDSHSLKTLVRNAVEFTSSLCCHTKGNGSRFNLHYRISRILAHENLLFLWFSTCLVCMGGDQCQKWAMRLEGCAARDRRGVHDWRGGCEAIGGACAQDRTGMYNRRVADHDRRGVYDRRVADHDRRGVYDRRVADRDRRGV